MEWSMVNLLNLGLDAAAMRQRVTAHNIANINTPGFQGSRVSFEEELSWWLQQQKGSQSKLRVTHSLHLGGPQGLPEPTVVGTAGAMRPDGNTVDIDSEQITLAANLIKYQALTRQASEQFARMRYVVTEGRR